MARLSSPAYGGKYAYWEQTFSSFITPLCYIASVGAVQLAEFLLDSGCDVNEGSKGVDNSALTAASRFGHVNVIRLLIDQGADINAQGGYWGSVLQLAAYKGSKSIVQLLLNRGADVKAQGGKYGNALQAAVAEDELDSIELLLSHGAELDPPGPQWEELLNRIAEDFDDISVDRLRKFREDPRGYVAAARASRNVWQMTGIKILI